MKKFMECWGPDRNIGRDALVTDDARCMAFGKLTEPQIKHFKIWDAHSCKYFPDYGPVAYDLFTTEDPNKIVVRAYCTGNGMTDDGVESHVELRYFFAFTLVDGKIRIFEENQDKISPLHAQMGTPYTYSTVLRD